MTQYKIYCTVDLKFAYHQLPISEKDKIYTAFEADSNLYQFCKVSFGVTHRGACFQKVDKFIANNSLSHTFANLDNITICGKNQENHDKNLNKFTETARNLMYNHNKCSFSNSSMDLVDYTISEGTIKPDHERLLPLKELPLPSDINYIFRSVAMLS